MIWKHLFSKLLSIFVLIIILPSLSRGNYQENFFNSNFQSKEIIKDNIKWSSSERLTWIGNSTEPVIGRDGRGNYHIVWQDDRNGNWDIYYLKVNLKGFKLLNDTRITLYEGNDTNPDMVASNDTVYIVWQREINGVCSIYFSRISYTDEDIRIDVPPKPIVSNGHNCRNPKIAMDGDGRLHIIWEEYINSNWDIIYQVFDINGNSKIEKVDVSKDESNSTRASIVVDDENDANIFWINEKILPGYSVLYRKVSPSGILLTEVKKISVVSPNSTVDSFFYNDSLYTVFSCSREMMAYEVIFTKLSKDGETIIDDKNLTPLDSKDSILPQIYVRDSSIFLLWNNVPEGKIMFSIFDLEGRRRGEILNLSEGSSFNPAMDMNEKSLGVVWESVIRGKRFLYFRSGELPNLALYNMEIKSWQKNVRVNATLYSTIPIWGEYTLYVDKLPLESGEIFIEEKVTISINVSIDAGEHTIKITLDPNNTVVEYLEEDNSLEQKIFIKFFSFKIILPKSIGVKPGEKKNLSVELINNGNCMDNYSLQIDYNTTLFSLEYPQKIENVTPGENRVINIEIFVHSFVLSSKYPITLNFTSFGSKEYREKMLNLSVLPEERYEIGYSPLLSGKPGEWVSVELSIFNSANSPDTYFINFSEEKPWPFKGESITNISLSPGEIYQYSLKLYIPSNSLVYEKNTVNFTVISASNITKYAEITVVVSPLHKVTGEVISVESDELHYRIKINVKNAGNTASLFNLNLSGEISPFALMSSSHLFLNPGKNETMEINIYLPPSLAAGTYNLYFLVFFENESLLSLPIKIGVPEKHSFAFQINKVKEGKNVRIDIQVKNTGNSPDVIHIKALLPGVNNTTWLLKCGDKNYTNETTLYLQQNESIVVSISPVTKLKDGSYKLLLELSSASGMKKEVEVPFFVGIKKISLWEKIISILQENWMYMAMAVGAIAAVLIYKFKLRK